MARLSLCLFGSLQVIRDGEPVAGFVSDKARALLAYLATERHRPHRRDALAALLWPDESDAAASHSLRQVLSNLRQILRDDASASPCLLIDRYSVQLNPSHDLWLDAAEFSKLLLARQKHQHYRRENCHPCLRRLGEAVALYRGPFLDGFAVEASPSFDEWVVAERERLHEQVLAALAVLTRYHERRGDDEQVRRYARWQLRLEPWREEAHRQLMRALAREGDRTGALYQFRTCQGILERELGVKASEATCRLYDEIKREAASVRIGPRPIPNNLPAQSTSFVGREWEIGRIEDLLSTERLVTLTGAGGCGKTRLALRVAEEVADGFPDGVWLVELASLTDPSQVLPAVAAVFQLREPADRGQLDRLLDYLAPRRALLILDNCEHLVGACAHLVSQLLDACPSLSVLATSREALRVAGEVTRGVPSLVTPDLRRPCPAGVDPLAVVRESEAVRLFVDRATAVSQEFQLAERNMLAVAEICRQLEGIPLAIELAAAWVRLLSVEELLAYVGDRFRLVREGSRATLPRHQTLRALIDWSYDLLDEPERVLFSRLSVFVGGWTVPAAVEVCALPVAEAGDVLGALRRLVDKSLLVAERGSDGVTRFRMPDTLRQYAWMKLVTGPDAAVIRDQHARYFATLAEQARPPANNADASANRLAIEHDNLLAALQWYRERDKDVERALSLAGALAKSGA